MKLRLAISFLAAALMAVAILPAAPQAGSGAEKQLAAAIHTEEVKGDLKGAIEQYKKLAQSPNRAVAASALVHLGQCYEKLGDAQVAEARQAYERVVRDFADQKEAAAEARKHLLAGGAQKSGSGRSYTQLLWDKAVDVWGTTTADGRFLSFPDWATGDLGVRDLVAGQSRRITNKGGYEKARGEVEGTAISPDGKLIAFTYRRWDGSKKQTEIRVIGADGTGERVLLAGTTHDLREAEPQSWSPDGRWIAAAVRAEGASGGSIQLLSPDGANNRAAVKLSDGVPRRIRFSPDGRWLAYNAQARAGSLAAGSERQNIYTVRAEGVDNSPHEVVSDALLGAWTPAGRGLLFGRLRNGVLEAFLTPVENGRAAGEPVELNSIPAMDAVLGAITTRGALIYSKNRRSTDAVIAPLDAATGTIGDLETVMPIASFGLGAMSGGVRFSPDGKQVLYTPTPKSILIRSITGGAERTIVPQMDRVGRIEWTADSNSLFVSGSAARQPEGVYRVDIRTGAASLIFAEPLVWLFASSPDGNTLYYRRQQAEIVARNLRTSAERRLFEPPETAVFDLKMSPDGKQLAVVSLRTIRFVNVETGDATVRYEHPSSISSKFWGGAWTPDGRFFLTIASFGPVNSVGELWTLPVNGGEPIRRKLPASFRGVWISPDGRQVAMQRWENLQQVWSVENFLPPGW